MIWGIMLLIAVGVYIVWDSRRMRREPVIPLSRERMRNGFKPGEAAAWMAFAAFGGVLTVMGAIAYHDPKAPPYAGRLAWLERLAYEQFGLQGQALLYWAAAALFFVLAASAARQPSK